MRSRIYIAATAIATIVVVGIAAAQEAPTAPAPVVRTPQQRGVVSDATRARTADQAPVVRTPAERGVVTEDQPDQPGQTLEQRQLVESVTDARTGGVQPQPGATLEQRQVQDQRGISLAERGLGDDILSGTELETGLPAVGTAQPGSVPLFVDPSGATATATSPSVTTGTSPSSTTGTSPQLTTGQRAAGAPTVIVIMPSPTTASPSSAGTGAMFVDTTTTVSPLFEASQQARRDARSASGR